MKIHRKWSYRFSLILGVSIFIVAFRHVEKSVGTKEVQTFTIANDETKNLHKKGFTSKNSNENYTRNNPVITAYDVKFRNKLNTTFSLPGCLCNRHGPDKVVPEKSLCSESATSRGYGQHVIGYTYFGGSWKQIQEHFMTIKTITKRAAEVYPEWIIRLHLRNVTFYNKQIHPTLCELFCSRKNFDVCVLEDLHNKTYNNFTAVQTNGRFWRMLPLLDPLVSVFMSRDIDAFILDREVVAVQEWMSSNLTYHILRDHPWHCLPMLAGLWGVKTSQIRHKHFEIWKKYVFAPIDGKKHWDQTLLQQYIYRNNLEYMEENTMFHDSYCCNRFPNVHHRPFQVKRDRYGNWCGGGQNYVLKYNKLVRANKCPIECRPEKHREWEFC